MMRPMLVIFTVLTTIGQLAAQLVYSDPSYATEYDSIVIYFDATKGNAGLLNYTGEVYAHTGVITDLSTQPSDWRYVVTPWPGGSGTANTLKNKLVRISTNLYKLTIGRPRMYYISHENGATIPATEHILKLAFVFRSADGSRTGRDVGGADIFLTLYKAGLTVIIEEPEVDLSYGRPDRSPFFIQDPADTVRIRVKTATLGTAVEALNLYVNDTLENTVTDSVLEFDFIARDYGYGLKYISVIGIDSTDIRDTATFCIMINPPVKNIPRPEGVIDGINYPDPRTATLVIHAPRKQFIYAIGDFSDWTMDTTFYMNCDDRGGDDVRWWVSLHGLNPGERYGFQYLVDGRLRLADPYSQIILDPWNDQYIATSTYPDLKPYPVGKTRDLVSIIQTAQTPYDWTDETYRRPAIKDLIIYELLIRDFVTEHDFQRLQDTLSYLEKLGVNAIELMPVNEFEGNSSWGYNPSFYFAPDKYYGPAEAFKTFINACHQRGIAVIMDIALNHSFGQSSLVRLYWDATNNRPAADNLWFNPTDHHPYGVGYDFNHESPATRAFAKRVLSYWLSEFHIDGFRLDLSKGFTQKYTYGNVGAWGAYDASRIAILEDYADQVWTVDSTAYVILEHFSDNQEEKELAEYGMLLWGNLSHDYQEAGMGWNADFAWGYYRNRWWTKPHLVTYMESHDEERVMYKNLQWGNSAGTYNIRHLSTALNRIKLNAAFFLTFPGPKMIWQFGELGYDVSIDNPCRLCEKPILWNYFSQSDRRNLYKTFAALLKLRRENDVFTNPNTNAIMTVSGYQKNIVMSGDPNVVIIGNFGVTAADYNTFFQHGGSWFDFFSGDSFYVSGSTQVITLNPGEFHIYTDRRLPTPESGIISGIESEELDLPRDFALFPNYPNPFNSTTSLRYDLEHQSDINIAIYDLTGREVWAVNLENQAPGRYLLQWQGRDGRGFELHSGVYLLLLQRGSERHARKITLLK